MGVLLGIYTALSTVVTAWLMAAVMRRTVGVRIGWPRAVLAACLALLIGLPLTSHLAVDAGVATAQGELVASGGVGAVFAFVVMLWVFAACLALVMLTEVVAPTGSVPGPREAYLGVRGWLRRSLRYAAILRAVGGTGAGSVLRRGPSAPGFGPALARALDRCGVTFVKLGQLLATRDDLLPGETTRALATLQTDASPAPADRISATLVSELGGPAQAVFARFDDEPLAAASVAQVHAARTRAGAEVVVKVQRPDARQQVAVDSDILLRLARTAEVRLDWAADLSVQRLAEGLAESLRRELDYRIEAANTRAVASTVAGRPLIVVPGVVEELSTARVLVLERLDGTPVAAGDAAVAHLTVEQRAALAEELVGCLLDSVFVHGVFHADLHPGNLLVLGDGRLGLLDFGAVGVLDSETRELLALMLLAVLGDDAVAAVDALLMCFDAPDDVDVGQLRRDLGRQVALVQLQERLSADTFGQLFGVLRRHRIAVPGDVAAAFRTLASVEATLGLLAPERTLLAAVRSELPDLLGRMAGPERSAKRALVHAGMAAAVARRLPERVEQVSAALADGRFTVRARAFADPADRRWVRDQVTNAVAAGFGIAACILAVVLVVRPGGPMLTAQLSLFTLLGAVLGFCGITLALRVMVQLFHRRE